MVNRQRIEEVFHAALGLYPEERTLYLSTACGSDTNLRGHVEALLEADSAAGGFLPDALGFDAQSLAAQVASELASGERFGRYVIGDLIREGGMGVFYRAEQDSPRRTVALKLLKLRFSTPGMRRRFEFEAEVLGRLQHPGIAQIFEAGATNERNARTHFAMEYIDGRPLLTYVKEQRLDTPLRLHLLATISDAVHYAHQSGVIHRDLKPNNILVDDAGRPKVLDFGVARAADADVHLTTMNTHAGQLIGTLPYVSPEQVAGKPNAWIGVRMCMPWA